MPLSAEVMAAKAASNSSAGKRWVITGEMSKPDPMSTFSGWRVTCAVGTPCSRLVPPSTTPCESSPAPTCYLGVQLAPTSYAVTAIFTRTPPLLVCGENRLDQLFIPRPAGREPLTHKIRLLSNQFDVEHARIIEIGLGPASPCIAPRLGTDFFRAFSRQRFITGA